MQNKNTLFHRILLMLLGIGILSLGVVLNTKTNLGVPPINSVPYVLSVLSEIELGNMMIIVYSLYVIVQMIIMKKRNDFKVKVIVQIPYGVLFGKFTTFFNTMIPWDPNQLPTQLCILVAAIFFTALGVVIIVMADIVMAPPDGMVYEISKLLKWPLGKTKTIVDLVSVFCAIILGLTLGGRLIGIGIGTFVSAIMVGRCIQIISKTLEKFQKSKV